MIVDDYKFKLIFGIVNFILFYLIIKKYIKDIVNICRWKEINVELYYFLFKKFFIYECDIVYFYIIIFSFFFCLRVFFN